MAGKFSALDVAKYFLSLLDEDEGDTISNLKLQKLLYYAQGLHLAVNRKPLFRATMKRWQHGPVVRTVWEEYTKYGARSISKPRNVDFSKFSEKDEEFLQSIYALYGQFSAWKLANMTHEEPPVRDTRINGTISDNAMKQYFETQLE